MGHTLPRISHVLIPLPGFFHTNLQAFVFYLCVSLIFSLKGGNPVPDIPARPFLVLMPSLILSSLLASEPSNLAEEPGMLEMEEEEK